MKPDYSKENLYQGLLAKEAAAETPANFARLEGAPQHRPTRDLDVANKRMAGGTDGGQRALAMLNDPVEKERTDNWMFMLRDFLNKTPPINAQNSKNATYINKG